MKDLSHLSDVTRFQTVLNHVENNPEIDGYVNVQNEDLGLVAGMMENGDVDAFAELMASGKITTDPTDPQNAVDVIYLPPYYVFKDRGTIFK